MTAIKNVTWTPYVIHIEFENEHQFRGSADALYQTLLLSPVPGAGVEANKDWADDLVDEIFHNAYFDYGDSKFDREECAKILCRSVRPISDPREGK